MITYPGTVVGPAAGSRLWGIAVQGWDPIVRFKVAPSFRGGVALIDVRDVADLHAAVMVPGAGTAPVRVCAK